MGDQSHRNSGVVAWCVDHVSVVKPSQATIQWIPFTDDDDEHEVLGIRWYTTTALWEG
jgi:hypothetical protein